jgi:hypothetical protein
MVSQSGDVGFAKTRDLEVSLEHCAAEGAPLVDLGLRRLRISSPMYLVDVFPFGIVEHGLSIWQRQQKSVLAIPCLSQLTRIQTIHPDTLLTGGPLSSQAGIRMSRSRKTYERMVSPS